MAKKKDLSTTRLVHKHHLRCAAWSPDGARVALGAYWGPVLVCDAATGETLKELAADGHGVAWSPDGARLLTGTGRGALVWDDAWRKILLLRGHKHAVHCVAWSPDGATLATGSGEPHTPADWSMRTWDVTTGGELLRVKFPAEVKALAWSPDGGGRIAVVGGAWMGLCDLAGKVMRHVRLAGPADSLAFTADGAHVIVPLGVGPACVFDATTGALVAWWDGREWGDGEPTVGGGSGFGAVACARQGTLCALSRWWRGPYGYALREQDVCVVDLATRRVVTSLRCGDGIALALDFSPDATRLLVARGDHTASIHRVEDGALIRGPVVRGREALAALVAEAPEALVALGPDAWAIALEQRAAEDGRARAIATQLLGRIVRAERIALTEVDPSAPAWARAALGDPVASVRRYAVEALASEASPAGDLLDLLERVLDDPDKDVRLEALQAYVRRAPVDARTRATLARVLGDAAPELRRVAVRALRSFDGAVMALEWKAARDDDASVRAEACDSLVARGEAAHPEALARITSEHAFDRHASVRVLAGAVGEPSVRAKVAALLEDPEVVVRSAAAQALLDAGRVTEDEFRPLARMTRSADWTERHLALRAFLSAGVQGRVELENVLTSLLPGQRDGLIETALATPGAELVVRHWAERTLDEAVMQAILQRMPEGGSFAEALTPWLASLVKGYYKDLRKPAKDKLARVRKAAASP